MRKYIIAIGIGLLILMSFESCSSNRRARTWGGTSTIIVERGQKVMNVTWKESDLWVLTESMSESDKPRTLHFSENSSIGILNGTVVLVESK